MDSCFQQDRTILQTSFSNSSNFRAACWWLKSLNSENFHLPRSVEDPDPDPDAPAPAPAPAAAIAEVAEHEPSRDILNRAPITFETPFRCLQCWVRHDI